MKRRVVALGGAAVVCGLLSTPSYGVTITIDYSQDTTGFFTANPAAKVSLEAAAARVGAMLTTPLAATVDSNSATVGGADATLDFSFSYPNPTTGSTTTYDPAVVPTGTIVIFAGAQHLATNTIGRGGPGGLSVDGRGGYIPGNPTSFANFQSAVSQASSAGTANLTRGGGPVVNTLSGSFMTDDGTAPYSVSYGISVGAITFDNDTNNDNITDSPATLNSFWNFDYTQPTGGKNDFYTVALHELTHAVGFSSTKSYTSLVSGADPRDWTGANVISIAGTGNDVLAPDSMHFSDGRPGSSTANNGAQEALMDPSLTTGFRKDETYLDIAALRDIGWQTVPLAATLQNWLAAGSGSWDTPGNWTGGAKPSPVSQVSITPANALSITGPAAASFAQSLSIGDGSHAVSLQLGAGSLTVTNGILVNGASSITGGASSKLMALGSNLTVNSGATYNNAGTLIAGTVTTAGTFTQTGPLSIITGVTVAGGTATLGGAQSWDAGATLSVTGGAASLSADPGSTSAYNAVVTVTPAAGSASLHVASHSGDQAHVADLRVNPVGTGGNGLLIIDAAMNGTAPNPFTNFGAVGGSVAAYIGSGAGAPGLAPRATVENLWQSAALEGYWALRNNKVSTITRGLTMAAGIVSDPTRNGLAVVPSVDSLNQPVTYVGEDIIGDANGDAKVDVNDVGVVLQHLNTTPGTVTGEAGYTIYTPGEGDVNGDLKVDVNDLGATLANLSLVYAPSSGSGTSGVPEPASAGVIAVGAAMLAARRRRR